MKETIIKEDLYSPDPTPAELVSIIRQEEAKIRKFGREEFTEWMNYAQSTYLDGVESQSWRDLRTEKLTQAVEDILQFTEALGLNESLNEAAWSRENGEGFLNALYRKWVHSHESSMSVTIRDMRMSKDQNGKDVYIIDYDVEDIPMDKYSKR